MPQTAILPVLEIANKAKRLLQQDTLAPQIGINCLSNLRSAMHCMTAAERAEVVSFDRTDAAAAELMEQYVSQPGITINFQEFVLAHLNIFIDELLLMTSQEI